MKCREVITLPILAVLLVLAPTALASNTWYVNGVNGNDSDDCKAPPTACKTIGHAISLASSGDSTVVAADTYTENLFIGISLKVIGAGASTTIVDGGGHGVVVTIGNGVQVSLSGLTIRNGHVFGSWTGCCQQEFGGGGIRNHGTLTINNSVVSRNTVSVSVKCPPIGGCGGAVYGGGIYSTGKLIINNSTVIGNVASMSGCSYQQACVAYGGAIFNHGTLTVTSTTISGNGGSATQSNGGGIYHDFGTLTVVNSTISTNTCSVRGFGGGIYNNNAMVSLSNTTLSGNGAARGGNIYGAVTVQNSIIANSAFGYVNNCYGTLTSNGYNLSSDGTCNLNGRGDLNNHDPLLGPLQNNGGSTETMALLARSPAIDAGNPAGCTDGSGHLLTTDQRGIPRPDREDTVGCDIGAYESQSDQP